MSVLLSVGGCPVVPIYDKTKTVFWQALKILKKFLVNDNDSY
jgi:hypothetical protein